MPVPRFEVLRHAMARRGMTYTDIAARTQLAIPHVRRVILGQHPNVSAQALARICQVLGVSLADVLRDELEERKTG